MDVTSGKWQVWNNAVGPRMLDRASANDVIREQAMIELHEMVCLISEAIAELKREEKS